MSDLMGGEDEPYPLPRGLREIQARAEARRAREPKMPPSGVLPRPAGPRPLQRMPHEGGPADFAPSHRNVPAPGTDLDGIREQQVEMNPYPAARPLEQ
jgi:hypothetical protein